MACKVYKKELVRLGYEDEPINEANRTVAGYWTNKIGGFPNWAVDGASVPKCQLCSLPQLLVTQIYAPLDTSLYHRTLYVFCCINPNCWNLSQSWTCYRCQILDDKSLKYEGEPKTVKIDWCAGADDWGDGDDNGNLLFSTTDSDDSSSLTSSFAALNVDQCNANFAQTAFGAAGRISPTAEIEGEEGEVVSIDTPESAQLDLVALLETAAPLPHISSDTCFSPFFIWVGDESIDYNSERERELVQEYVKNHGDITITTSNSAKSGEEDERYERTVPLHGDLMCHQFITTLQSSPGQILRYSRGSSPLLMAAIDPPKHCRNCSSSLVFEMQIVPALLNKLHLPGDNELHVDFGNVVIYTCKESCWKDGDVFREEVVCVQAEVMFCQSK